MYKKFIIKYEIILTNESIIRNKEIKVSKCFSNIEAQVKLEKYLIKKHNEFKQLVVHSCTEDFMSGFDDIFNGFGNGFGDIFGKK